MKKKSLALLLSGLIICSVCACGKKEESVAEVETPVVEKATEVEKPTEPEKVEEPETTEEAAEEAEDFSWVNEYLNYFNSVDITGDEKFEILFINDDDIPEIIDQYVDYDGSGEYRLLTIGKYGINQSENSAYDIQYIPNGNIISFSNIYSDGSDETIYSIENQNWKKIFIGNSIEDREKGYTNSEGSEEAYPMRYYLEGIETPEEEYTKKRNSIVDNDRLEAVEFNYNLNEVKRELNKYLPHTASEENKEYSWVNPYLEYLGNVNTTEYPKASMIYVNDDSVPEIILEGDGHYLGSIALTIGKDDAVKEHHFASTGYARYMPQKNIIHDFNSGAGGASDDISCIEDGEWKTLFFGDYWNDPEPKSNFKIYDKGYWEEGKGRSVSEEKYNNTMKAILDERGYEEEKTEKVEFKYTISELIEELKKLQVDNNSKGDEDTEPWKVVYRNCLNDIINGKENLSDGMDAFTYNVIGRAYFALQDITDDGIPELLVSVDNDNPYWTIYTANGDDYENIGNMSFFDSESKKVYAQGQSTFEEYYIYVFKDGKLMLDSLIGEADADVPYFQQDAQGNQSGLSASDMDAFRSGFKAGLEKYGIKGMELTKENIDKELGTNVGTGNKSKGNKSDVDPDSLLDSFLHGEIPAYRHNDYSGESSFMISDLPIDVDDAYSYHIGERVDLDNDGEKELILEMDMDGGMYLDADTLNKRVNVFAEGDGTAHKLSYTNYDGAIWIVYRDDSHGTRAIYELIKYNGGNDIADSFELSWEDPNDKFDENSDYRYRGKKISMKEFEELRKEILGI